MNSTSTNRVSVEPGGKGVVAHIGLHALGSLADALGLGSALTPRIEPASQRAPRHDRGKVLVQMTLAQLPEVIRAGHGVDDESTLSRGVIARADNAGCAQGFLAACRVRHVNFSVTARSNAQLQSAIYTVSQCEDLWQPSRTQGGELRHDAAVCEVTDYLNLRKMPSGTRCIVRREPLHPGAQRSLFPSDEFRYWGFYTDYDGDPVDLDLTMRAHAHVEDHIQRLKESGLTRFPFTNFEANANWLMTVAMAGDLVRWFQLLCLDGSWKDARVKALRSEIFHAPGRIVRGARRVVVRLLGGWPTARQLLNAYQRIVLLT
ncbi:MAG: hypothetical protein HIU84_08360 [Acidobacteria bacterium]|nr:hypothetical protein [Acidobacteriota bacterium]